MAQHEMNLAEYWRILVKRRVILATTTVAIGALTFLLARPPEPRYHAVAKILLAPAGPSAAGGDVDTVALAQEAERVRSRRVATLTYYVLEYMADTEGLAKSGLNEADRQMVRDAINAVQTDLVPEDGPGLPPFDFGALFLSWEHRDVTRPLDTQDRQFVTRSILRFVSVGVNDESRGLSIRARSRVPWVATLLTEVVAQVYVRDLGNRRAVLLKAAVRRAEARVASTQALLDAEAEDESRRAALSAAQRRLLQAQRCLDERPEAEASIVQHALSEGSQPTGAGRMTKGIVGLVVGFILGLVMAVLRETFDMTSGTVKEVEAYLDTEVLGVLPHLDVDRTAAAIRRTNHDLRKDQTLAVRAALMTRYDPQSVCSEAVRSIRTYVEFVAREKGAKAFVVTSAVKDEGKTTVAANLALALAQDGRKTLLVDADLRAPSVHQMLGVDAGPGIGEFLMGHSGWRELVRPGTDLFRGETHPPDPAGALGLADLSVLTSGLPLPNPAELLGSARMAELLAELRSDFEFVLLDSPDILSTTDAVVLASQVDSAILVYRARQANRSTLERARSHLDRLQIDVCGIVLNDLPHSEWQEERDAKRRK